MKILAMNRTYKSVVVCTEFDSLEDAVECANAWNHEETRPNLFVDYLTDGIQSTETPYNIPMSI